MKFLFLEQRVCARIQFPGGNADKENMPNSFNSIVWTAFDHDLLRSLRIKSPTDLQVERDPKLFCTALALLVPGLAFLALWIAYVIQM
jgi:hypothetical protein